MLTMGRDLGTDPGAGQDPKSPFLPPPPPAAWPRSLLPLLFLRLP